MSPSSADIQAELYAYANGNPISNVDPLGLSAADVEAVINNVAQNFPEIHPNGGWEFGALHEETTGGTNPLSGKITLPEAYKKQCLSEDEFRSLYFDYLHEAMHSTDSRGTRLYDSAMQNLFGVTTSHHWSIYNRAEYEQFGVLPKGYESDGV